MIKATSNLINSYILALLTLIIQIIAFRMSEWINRIKQAYYFQYFHESGKDFLANNLYYQLVIKLMDRQNKRQCQSSKPIKINDELCRWDYQQNQDQKQNQSIFKYLCNNICLYDHAYRKQENHTFKRGLRGSVTLQRNKNRSSLHHDNLISITEGVHRNQSKNRIRRQRDSRKRIMTDCSQLQNMENLNDNLLVNLRQLRGKYSQTANANLSVKNVEFSKQSKDYIRKKDRYRQIFGEKPKFIYVKADDEHYRNRIGISATLFKPR